MKWLLRLLVVAFIVLIAYTQFGFWTNEDVCEEGTPITNPTECSFNRHHVLCNPFKQSEEYCFFRSIEGIISILASIALGPVLERLAKLLV